MVNPGDILKYYKLGRDYDSVGGQTAKTRRCYVPSLEHVRASGHEVNEDDDLLTVLPNGIHLTPEGVPNERGLVVRYPRYLYVCLCYGTADQKQEYLAALLGASSALSSIGTRIVIVETAGKTFEHSLIAEILYGATDYEGGELYVANVFLDDVFGGDFGTTTEPSPLVYGTYYGGYFPYSSGRFPGGEHWEGPISNYAVLPSEVPPGETVLETQLVQASNGASYFKITTIGSTISTQYIADRQAALQAHGPRFRKFRVCDYYMDRNIKFAGTVSYVDGQFVTSLIRALVNHSGFGSVPSVFGTANPGPWSTSQKIATPTEAGANTVADAVAFFIA